jgi:hypothetical protein
MSNFDPIFIPISKLNGKECLTHNLLNFTGSIHYTPDGVLICSAEYNGLEEDLERAFDRIQLCEMDRQLLRGAMLESSPVTFVVKDDEAIAVAAATASTAAAATSNEDGIASIDGAVKEEGFNGEDGDGDGDGDGSDNEDEDTVTDLPSSKLQFDSDDDSYDEDQHFSQQASFYS